MSQQSEERLPEAKSAEQLLEENASSVGPAGARILPFPRPQSDLQRAIQQRAQEAIDLDRDRDREVRRPRPLKWVTILLIAMIPVVLIFGAVDGFLRAFYRLNEAYSSQPANPAPPAAEPEPPVTQEPGVVILQPYQDSSQSETPAPSTGAPQSN